MSAQPTMVFHLANLVVGVGAMLSGIALTVINYFWLHSDTDLTRRQMWEHVGGLLFFFTAGSLFGGTAIYAVLRLAGVHL